VQESRSESRRMQLETNLEQVQEIECLYFIWVSCRVDHCWKLRSVIYIRIDGLLMPTAKCQYFHPECYKHMNWRWPEANAPRYKPYVSDELVELTWL